MILIRRVGSRSRGLSEHRGVMAAVSARSPLIRWSISVGVLPIVVLSSCAAPAAPDLPRPTPRASPTSVVTITTGAAARGLISAPLVYTGAVRARYQVNVVSTVGGRIGRLSVDVGDEVGEGEMI